MAEYIRFASTSALERMQRMQAVTAVAARALGADGACAVLHQGSKTTVAARFGDSTPLAAVPELEGVSLGEPLLVVGDGSHPDLAAALTRAGVPFYASAAFAVDATTTGFLCAYGAEFHTVGGAAELVLRTCAKEIAANVAQVPAGTLDAFESDEFDRQQLYLRLLESVVVNAHDAVVITEAPVQYPGPRILYANASFTRMTGYELDEVLGKTPRILHGPGTAPSSRERLREALHHYEPIETELLNYRKDGTPFWVELSIVPVPDENGRITHWVSVQRDITERKAAEEAAVRARVAQAENVALAYRADHDDLTGLLNRASFLKHVAGSLPGSRSAVLFLDLDRFKIINDSLGHRAGDLLLIEVARRLRACVRTHDVLARLGGDEFVCLLDQIGDEEEAVAIARRILAALREPVPLFGQSISARASIGISMVDRRYELPEDVLRDADTAMYRAKREGGARFAIFEDEMHARALAMLHAVTDLNGALERDEFVLHYQPLVEVATGRACAFEALVRWNHPDRGLVLPSDFIPAAEESGLIADIGRWVLRGACRQAQVWNAGRPDSDRVSVSVNVSSRQFDDRDVCDAVQGALADSGLDPRSLQIEITESVFLDHPESAGALLEQIRALGVRVVLDKFGTGYSSLSCLQRYPIDAIKIDRSFVERLATSETTIEVVRLIVGLAKTLAMDVAAEGIEDEAQLSLVKLCGCSHAQGQLFARPLSAPEVAVFLQRNEETRTALAS